MFLQEVIVGPENRTVLSNDKFLRVNLIGDFVGYTSLPSFEDFYLVTPRLVCLHCFTVYFLTLANFQSKTITSSISCFLIGCLSPIIPLHCGTSLVGRSKIHENGILVAPLDLPKLGIANGRVFSPFPCFSFYKDTHDCYS